MITKIILMLPDGTNQKLDVEIKDYETLSMQRKEIINQIPGVIIATQIIEK